MSRFDGKLDAAGEASVAPSELLAALEAQGLGSLQDRQDAIARCLSLSEGWKESLMLLGGAFAADVARTRVKGD